MKYVNTYTDSANFESDKTRLGELDDIWAAFVLDEQKTYINKRQEEQVFTSIATYDFQGISGEHSIINNTNNVIDSVKIKKINDSVIDEPVEVVTGEISIDVSNRDGIYEIEYVFKEIENADLSNLFNSIYELTTISDGFFNRFISISNIDSLFSTCYGLTTIPSNLFEKCKNITSINSTFFECDSLTNIPGKLFKSVGASLKTLDNVFTYCYSLNTIPEDLFEGCTEITDLNAVFFECENIKKIPRNLLKDLHKLINVDYLFDGCRWLQCIAPLSPNNVELYQDSEISGTNCFHKCDLMYDYGLIPAEWGGTTNKYYCSFKRNLEKTYIQLFTNSVPDYIQAVVIYNTSYQLLNEYEYPNIPLQYSTTEERIIVCIAFNSTDNVTDLFYNTDIYTINGDIFTPTRLTLVNATGCFDQCYSLIAIVDSNGTYVFDTCGSNLQSVSRCFQDNSSLNVLPGALFMKNTQITDFSNCFNGCTSLTGNAPNNDGIRYWEREGKEGYPQTITGTGCFTNCTGLVQYKNGQIPTPWGGFNNKKQITVYMFARNYQTNRNLWLGLDPNSANETDGTTIRVNYTYEGSQSTFREVPLMLTNESNICDLHIPIVYNGKYISINSIVSADSDYEIIVKRYMPKINVEIVNNSNIVHVSYSDLPYLPDTGSASLMDFDPAADYVTIRFSDSHTFNITCTLDFTSSTPKSASTNRIVKGSIGRITPEWSTNQATGSIYLTTPVELNVTLK